MNANAGPLILLPVDGSERRRGRPSTASGSRGHRRACPRPERPAEFEDWQTTASATTSPQAPRGPLARKGGAGPRNPRRTPARVPAREGEAAETIGRIAEEKDCVGVVMARAASARSGSAHGVGGHEGLPRREGAAHLHPLTARARRATAGSRRRFLAGLRSRPVSGVAADSPRSRAPRRPAPGTGATRRVPRRGCPPA